MPLKNYPLSPWLFKTLCQAPWPLLWLTLGLPTWLLGQISLSPLLLGYESLPTLVPEQMRFQALLLGQIWAPTLLLGLGQIRLPTLLLK